MQDAVAERLIALNKQFYQALAQPFSASRARPQAGVLRVLENVPAGASILDLGCGNGVLAAELARRGHTGRYLGLDFSAELLSAARGQSPLSNLQFLEADLTQPDWSSQLEDEPFDFVFAFAVLHHIPGQTRRLSLLRQARTLLRGDGSKTRPYKARRLALSNWQFLNSPRLRARIQPWEAAGLQADDVDQSDYLLDWRAGGRGLRYAHHFSEEELAALAAEAGFSVKESFLSDGAGGNLGLYQWWEA
ncbi:MAG: class I SAM-dependent methyltransferase [Anaerolineales bacterium]|nr:class I SAM-dependent methyltransferase [Anaerolineales bacterium]